MKLLFLSLGLLASASELSAELIPLEDFVVRDRYGSIKISPDGKHLAATVSNNGSDVLVILDTDTFALKSSFRIGPKNEEVQWFDWATSERVLVTSAINWGTYDFAIPTGKMFSADIDGKKRKMVFGYEAGEQQTGTRLHREEPDHAWPTVISKLKNSPKEILITSHPFSYTKEVTPKAYRMNIKTGKKGRAIRSPINQPDADFMADQQGDVRIAYGLNQDGSYQIHHRAGKNKDWEMLFRSEVTDPRVYPQGLNGAGDKLYIAADYDGDRLGLYEMDLSSKEMKLLYRHNEVDIERVIWNNDQTEILGVKMMPGAIETYFFDPKHPQSKLLRVMANTFKGHDVDIMSWTEDANRAIVRVTNSSNPGDYYLFNRATQEMRFLLASQRQLDPNDLADKEPVSLTARDGVKLHGYLTRSKSAEQKPGPMVVYIHGGPHSVRDRWSYDHRIQILANRGLNVLQVNYRGSGGYGNSFEKSGFGKWGREMQDDITDATLWAINEGIADPERICIMGASYGGYASLMGVVREPDLYQCAIGFVGVYDLSLMQKIGSIQRARRNQAYLDTAVGYIKGDLKQRSPVSFADRIKADVMLIHGKKDERVPFKHAEVMRQALIDAGKEPEWLVFDGEGHGLRAAQNRLTYFKEVLAFLDQQIGLVN